MPLAYRNSHSPTGWGGSSRFENDTGFTDTAASRTAKQIDLPSRPEGGERIISHRHGNVVPVRRDERPTEMTAVVHLRQMGYAITQRRAVGDAEVWRSVRCFLHERPGRRSRRTLTESRGCSDDSLSSSTPSRRFRLRGVDSHERQPLLSSCRDGSSRH
jgi:hypothetical protein